MVKSCVIVNGCCAPIGSVYYSLSSLGSVTFRRPSCKLRWLTRSCVGTSGIVARAIAAAIIFIALRSHSCGRQFLAVQTAPCVQVVGTETVGDRVKLTYESTKDGTKTDIECDIVLVATGRRPFTGAYPNDAVFDPMHSTRPRRTCSIPVVRPVRMKCSATAAP